MGAASFSAILYTSTSQWRDVRTNFVLSKWNNLFTRLQKNVSRPILHTCTNSSVLFLHSFYSKNKCSLEYESYRSRVLFISRNMYFSCGNQYKRFRSETISYKTIFQNHRKYSYTELVSAVSIIRHGRLHNHKTFLNNDSCPQNTISIN